MMFEHHKPRKMNGRKRRRLRRVLYDQQNGLCHWCGIPMLPAGVNRFSFTIDHLFTDDGLSFVGAHRLCNNARHHNDAPPLYVVNKVKRHFQSGYAPFGVWWERSLADSFERQEKEGAQRQTRTDMREIRRATTSRGMFDRAGSKPAGKNHDQDDDQDDPGDTARVIAPPSAVRPCRERADQNQNQDDQ